MPFRLTADRNAAIGHENYALGLRHPILANAIDRRDRYHPVVIDHLAGGDVLLRCNDGLFPGETYRVVGQNLSVRVKIVWEKNEFRGGVVYDGAQIVRSGSPKRSFARLWSKKLARMKS